MTRAILQQALEALTEHGAPYLRHGVDWDNAITAIRAHLDTPEQEPVAWMIQYEGKCMGFVPSKEENTVPVYLAPTIPEGTLLYLSPTIPPGWLRAVDEAMVGSHLGVADASDSYEVAKKKLNDLICWNIQVATDPAVNGGMVLVPEEGKK